MNREILRELLAFAARDDSTPAEWLEKNVVLSRHYGAAGGPFSFARWPFWRDVVNHAAERRKLEIIVWKCSQAGGTESVLQGALRWAFANRPAPFLWVGAQRDAVVNFWEVRLMPGLLDSGEALRAVLRGAVETSGRLVAANGAKLIATWSSSRGGVKSLAYEQVFCDEVSTYSAFALEKIRPRTENYPEGKIWIMSALDKRKKGATRDDPLFREWSLTDRREWTMPDPGDPCGGRFRFSMGWDADKGEQDSGLKWDPAARDENGDWDLQRVAETAHFVCPSGAIITEADRAKTIDSGRWEPTADGRPGAVGYRVPCFLLRHKTFAETACGFLRAKKTGVDALRTFILEELAEEWKESRIVLGDTAIDSRRADYPQGNLPSKAHALAPFYVGAPSVVFVSGDVQKLSLYWLAREWICKKTGLSDSGLLDWREVIGWEEFEELTRAANARESLIDYGYKFRQAEVLAYAEQCPNIIPCLGRNDKMKQLYSVSVIDSREGKRGGGRRANGIGMLVFDAETVGKILMQMMQGKAGYPRWMVPRDVSRRYVEQVTAEEIVEGHLVERRPGADNHLFDCEKMQVLAAIYYGLFSPFSANYARPEEDSPRIVDNQKQLRLAF